MRGKVPQERLLTALAEDLKGTLLYITHQAELQGTAALTEIDLTARQGLHLIDSYVRSTEQAELELEPVSISSVLYDVAQTLDPLVRQYGGELELSVDGKYGPVMAHQPSLEAMLVTVGRSLLEADTNPKPRVVLSTYRTAQGINAGVLGNHPDLNPSLFRRALALYGRTRQPLPGAHALNGAGLYVADLLCEQMEAQLRVVRRHNMTGLAAYFMPSAQLQLV